jgi:Holliday junction resolvasome RuvABC endonuclease subunit
LNIIGVDYSITSPAICIHSGNSWQINTCSFHFFLYGKKYENFISTEQFKAYKYPENRFSSSIERFSFLSDWVLEKCDTIDYVAIEGYSFGSSAGRSFDLGENGGLLKYKLCEKNIPFDVVPPKTIKKFATDNGNASKQLMESAFISETDLNPKTILQQTSEKCISPSSDIIDSYFIAMWGFNNYQKILDSRKKIC